MYPMSLHIQFVSSDQISRQDESRLLLPNTLSMESLRQVGLLLENRNVTFSADLNTSDELIGCATKLWKQTNLETIPNLPKPPNNSQITALSDLVNNYYLRHAWGSKTHQNEIKQIEFEAGDHRESNINLKTQLLQAQADGERAFQLVNELKGRMLRDTVNQIQDWVKLVSQGLPNRVVKSINIAQSKQIGYLNKQKVRNQSNKGYRISTKPLELHGDIHPNYLPALRPADNWRVVIDETGDNHNSNLADDGPEKTVGKFVALVVPDSVNLESLEKGFHATDIGDRHIEKILERLTSVPVGIFGFSVMDPVASGHSWYLQVDLLIRWVLRLLPIDSGRQTNVIFEIEEYSSYKPTKDLSIRGESVLSELMQLSATRYENLSLHMKFVSKGESELNGYVDALANCWGSPSPMRSKFLRHFRLLDHCLLTPKVEGIFERALIAMVDGRPLSPIDWYTLVSSVQSLGSRTLIDDVLLKLGERSQGDSSLWISYLSEVRERISIKALSPHSLTKVIGWLEQFKPQGLSIPKLVNLQLCASRLALENHQGLSIQSNLTSTIALAFELLEEDAPQACEAILRAVVAMTNIYNFETMTPYVDQLLKEPVKVYGLSNYGKLLSTRGQLAIFNGDSTLAVEYFDQALTTFEKLSDPQQRQRELLQTGSYRLFALVDLEATDANEIHREFQTFVQSISGSALSHTLPDIHNWDGIRRFEHHLFLRAIVSGRLNRIDYGKIYLESFDNWSSGEDHPWQLICFYRALLLAQNKRIPDAQVQIRYALDICDNHPEGTITWIGAVIAQCAEHLTILPKGEGSESIDRCAAVKRALPNAPIDRLRGVFGQHIDVFNVDIALRELLPFNFR